MSVACGIARPASPLAECASLSASSSPFDKGPWEHSDGDVRGPTHYCDALLGALVRGTSARIFLRFPTPIPMKDANSLLFLGNASQLLDESLSPSHR